MAFPPAPVVPCCTNCKGTAYSYRPETIAGVPGLLVYCSTCGGIFSRSAHVLKAAKSLDGNAV